jgi:hypothetical protein
VKKKSGAAKENLTMSTQSYPSALALAAGTCTQSDCLSAQVAGKCCVQLAMMPRQEEKEKLEKMLEEVEGEFPANMGIGMKFDSQKPALAYIPKAALYAEGQAFAYGAKKYDAWNYRNGIAVSRTLSAALRHITQFIEGEEIDSESGVHHLGCARANLGMALDTLTNHPEMDDRFKGGKK